jgi:hypothetical protein
MVRGWMPSACPAATLSGLQNGGLGEVEWQIMRSSAERSPLVYDPDVDPGTNKRICAHNPCGAGPQYEDVDLRDTWHDGGRWKWY